MGTANIWMCLLGVGQLLCLGGLLNANLRSEQYDISFLQISIERPRPILNDTLDALPNDIVNERREREAWCLSLVNDRKITYLNDPAANLSYPDELRHPHPSYLFSYGGSGNTLTRTLIELVTRIWTTSIYHDVVLKKHGFKGEELRCDPKGSDRPVLLIKAHPEWMDRVRKDPRNLLRRCLGKKKGVMPVHYHSASAVFIMRNPWKAMFTLFQFKYGAPNEDRHTRHLRLERWDRGQWVQWVAEHAELWRRTAGFMRLMDSLPLTGYHVVKYENVIERSNTTVAVEEIRKVVRYLFSDSFYEQMAAELQDRMECAVGSLMRADYGRLGRMHRKAANESVHLTFDVAYQFLREQHPEVLCTAWNHIKEVAVRYSYRMLPGMDCVTNHTLNGSNHSLSTDDIVIHSTSNSTVPDND